MVERPIRQRDHPGDDALAIRANFALCVCYSPPPPNNFFPITPPLSSIPPYTISSNIDKGQLANDLQYLVPNGSATDRQTYIQNFLDTLPGLCPATVSAINDADGQPIIARVDYISALYMVRNLFNSWVHGWDPSPLECASKDAHTDKKHTSVSGYTGGGNCPRGTREILSLVTDHPTLIYPNGN